MNTKGKNARGGKKEDDEDEVEDEEEEPPLFDSFFDFIGVYGGTLNEDDFFNAMNEFNMNNNSRIDSIDFSKWL